MHNVWPRAMHNIWSRAMHNIWSRAMHNVWSRAMWSRAMHNVWSRAMHNVWSRALHDVWSRALHNVWSRALHNVSTLWDCSHVTAHFNTTCKVKISADDILKYFFLFFSRKQNLTFHANFFLGDNLHEIYQIPFSEKKKKKKKISPICRLLNSPR